MNKNLPKVYAVTNSIEANVQDVFYDSSSEDRTTEKNNIPIDIKINKIFHSPSYIYKQNVLIKTKEGEKREVIIGKSGNNLLTFDNRTIDIDSIIDITAI